MLVLKKLLFAPIFLIIFVTLNFQIAPLLKSYDFIFSLSSDTLIQLIIISVLITISSLSFSLFATLALDWKIVLPLGILASLIPFVFMEPAQGTIFMVGIIVSVLLIFTALENQMKTYLTFNPNSLLGPSVRHLSALLIIVISIVYFLSVSKIVAEKGFQIPDSLIDTALKFSQPQTDQESPTSQLPLLSSEQLDLLKKNPELLKQYGLDPKILDNLNQPLKDVTQVSNYLIKQTVKDQVQSFLEPYLGFIPAVLALLLFFTFQGLTSLINLLIYPLLWITFYILEKSGFIKFVVEQRPVKKMVV